MPGKQSYTTMTARAVKLVIGTRGGRRGNKKCSRYGYRDLKDGNFLFSNNLTFLKQALHDEFYTYYVQRTKEVSYTYGTVDEVNRVVQSIVLVIVTYVKSQNFMSGKTKKWLLTFYTAMMTSFRVFAKLCFDINHNKGIAGLMKVVKNRCSWNMLKVAGTVVDLEESALVEEIFSGRLKRFIRKHVNRAGPTSRELLRSLHFAKNVWPGLRDEDLNEKMQSHKILISRPIAELPEVIKSAIRAGSRDVFRDLPPMTKFCPTGRSCLQAGIRDNGTLSLVVPFTRDKKLEEEVGRLRGISHTIALWRIENWRENLNKAFSDFKSGVANDIKIISVPKPGSARILSIGNGYVNNALQPLQGAMLGAWKKTQQSTMKDEDLTSKVQRMADASPEIPYFFASDYTNATNLLNRITTFHALCGLDGVPLIDVARWSFGQGNALFPDGETVEHREAQMMGHTLSFPLLCIINRAILRCALNEWCQYTDCKGVVHTVKQANSKMARRYPNIFRIMKKKIAQARAIYNNALINGDDILFKADQLLVELFTKFATDTGFRIEATKQFMSANFATINSQDFHIFPSGKVRRLRYLNQRLLYGSDDRQEMTNPLSVARDLNRMLLPMKWARDIFKIPLERLAVQNPGYFHNFQPNWYLPVHLGGYGLDPIFARDEIKFTRPQRLVAAHFVNDTSHCLFVSANKVTNPIARLSKFVLQKCTIEFISHTDEELSDDESFFIHTLFPDPPEEIIEKRDPWEGRLCLLNRLHTNKATVDQGFSVRKIRKIQHLKPIRTENIKRYLKTRLKYSHPIPCPEFNILTTEIRSCLELNKKKYGCYDGSENVETQLYFPKEEWPERIGIASWGCI